MRHILRKVLMLDEKPPRRGVFALYSYLDDTLEMVTALRSDDRKFDVFTPTYYHELEEALSYHPSNVRWFTLTGALLGATFGFGLCLLTDYDWPLVVGGKSAGIYSLPAYVVIGFEMMILLGAVSTIFGMLFLGKIPNPKGRIYSTETTNDKFGVYVYDIDKDSETAKMLQNKADKIEIMGQ